MENKRTPASLKSAFKIIHIAVLIIFAAELLLRATTGRPISGLLFAFLVLTAPFKLYKNIQNRNKIKDNPDELKQHDRVLIKCILLALLIVTAGVIITVIHATSKYR